MSQNRLNLDFSLVSRKERLEYAIKYLGAINFTPNEAELDTISKYILWGKPDYTQNVDNFELETRYKTWSAQKTESLDALVESPNFSESSIRSPHNPPTKIPHVKFSRAEARAKMDASMKPVFDSLWNQIDRTELLLNFYEINNGRRKKEPREKLLLRFSPEDRAAIEAEAHTLKPYTALKLKHELAELRTTQYLLKDSYAPQIFSCPTFSFREEFFYAFGEDVRISPAGLPTSKPIDAKIWNEERFPQPEDFNEEELREVGRRIWRGQESAQLEFNFEDEDQVHSLLSNLGQLARALEDSNEESGLEQFARALRVYVKLAPLSEMERDIMKLKVRGVGNQEIAQTTNKKYGKNYRANYISTIWCKKIIGTICATAKRHRLVLENLAFPENFKKCKDCGSVLLLDEENFVRRARSTDGFSPRCKDCEKKKRKGDQE